MHNSWCSWCGMAQQHGPRPKVFAAAATNRTAPANVIGTGTCMAHSRNSFGLNQKWKIILLTLRRRNVKKYSHCCSDALANAAFAIGRAYGWMRWLCVCVSAVLIKGFLHYSLCSSASVRSKWWLLVVLLCASFQSIRLSSETCQAIEPRHQSNGCTPSHFNGIKRIFQFRVPNGKFPHSSEAHTHTQKWESWMQTSKERQKYNICLDLPFFSVRWIR